MLLSPLITVQEAVEIVRQGRIVAFPTGTAYGLAVSAVQGFALQRLRNLKKRPEEKTFTICLKPSAWDEYLLLSYAERSLLEGLIGQSLTVLVRGKPRLEHLLQDGRIGLRVTDHPLMAGFVEAVGVPITATSANMSGKPPCFSPEMIQRCFPGLRDETTYDLSLGGIIDGGRLPECAPSTMIRLEPSNKEVEIVRQGACDSPTLSVLLKGYGWALGA